MKTHELKKWPKEFDSIRQGIKTYEIRKDDRNFAVGDLLILEEFKPDTGTYTGRVIERRVVYISRPDGELRNVEADGLREGFCVLGLEVA